MDSYVGYMHIVELQKFRI